MAANVLSQRHIGEVIRMLRKRTPLTVEQLAGAVGVSAASVSGYERGTVVPGLVVVRRIVNVLAPHLDVDPESLWKELGTALTGFIAAEDLGKRLAQWGVPVVENRILLDVTAGLLGVDPEQLWEMYGRSLDEVDR